MRISLFLIFVKKQSQELTRVNPDRNIFTINVELTSTFLLYTGLVNHHHRILNDILSEEENERWSSIDCKLPVFMLGPALLSRSEISKFVYNICYCLQ